MHLVGSGVSVGDLTSFIQPGLVLLRTENGVNHPSVIRCEVTGCRTLKSCDHLYVWRWRSYSAQTEDIVASARSGEPLDVTENTQASERHHSFDCDIPDAVPGNVISVTEDGRRSS